MRWTPAKPRTRIKVVECGCGYWDEQDHGLDIPHGIDTTDFRITGTGHDRIERTYQEGCANSRKIIGFSEKQPEHRIADWLCRHVCSFVLFDTKPRATDGRPFPQVAARHPKCRAASSHRLDTIDFRVTATGHDGSSSVKRGHRRDQQLLGPRAW